MLTLPTRHPSFDLAHELLLLLRSLPHGTAMNAIVEDLGLSGQFMVRPLINSLRSIGITVKVTYKGNGGLIAYVDPPDWRHAQAVAEKYWDTMFLPPFPPA